jgi:hypothetical protein
MAELSEGEGKHVCLKRWHTAKLLCSRTQKTSHCVGVFVMAFSYLIIILMFSFNMPVVYK